MDLQGASRTTGGIFSGKALGNTPNAADFSAMESTSNAAVVQAIVAIFHSPTGPGNAGKPLKDEPDFRIKVEFTVNPQVLCDLLLERGSITFGKISY